MEGDLLFILFFNRCQPKQGNTATNTEAVKGELETKHQQRIEREMDNEEGSR